MPNFTAGTSFTDGVTNDVTALKLNALVADAVPTSSLSLNSTTGTISLFSSGTGTAATPAIQPTGDTNTGIFFPAADTIAFSEGGAEAMRIDSSGNVGIGTSSPATKLSVVASANSGINVTNGTMTGIFFNSSDTSIAIGSTSNHPVAFLTNNAERLRIDSSGNVGVGTASPSQKLDVYGAVAARGTLFLGDGSSSVIRKLNASTPLTIANSGGVAEMTIDSSGNVLVGKTAPSTSTVGFQFSLSDNKIACGAASGPSAFFNRNTDDGIIVQIAKDGTVQGDISVSGTTVSYNGGHLARWSQLPSGQRDPAIKKGTVLSNLDAMCEWKDADGNLLPNEQLNKVKISDVESDLNTAGVFVNWDNDDQDNPYDLNMAMTGDMIIRIAQGTSVNRGDLLMSAGDGTAKPQGDDIIRSKTIAKVTSTNVTCTYEDGSYCVPCVLMAC